LLSLPKYGGYTGGLIEWVLMGFGWTLEIVHKVVGVSGFNVLPKRWIAVSEPVELWKELLGGLISIED
jgi:hypothetical protein